MEVRTTSHYQQPGRLVQGHIDSLHFNGHFPSGPWLAGTRMSPFWILLELSLVEVVVITGTIWHAKVQSKCHHQQMNTQFFYRPDALPVAHEGILTDCVILPSSDICQFLWCELAALFRTYQCWFHVYWSRTGEESVFADHYYNGSSWLSGDGRWTAHDWFRCQAVQSACRHSE